MEEELTQGKTCVLPCCEAESYIDSLEPFPIQDVGSQRWLLQHERLSKLNLQGILSANVNEDEYVKEAFVSSGKIQVLVIEVLITELWKENVFKELVKLEIDQGSHIPVYTVLYHEAVILNLLETLLYHQDALDSIIEVVEDLIEYCYRKIVQTLFGNEMDTSLSVENEDCQNELIRQKRDLEFGIAIKALSVLCYICEQVSSLPLTGVHQLLKILDVPLLLVELVERLPWIRQDKRFSNGILQPIGQQALIKDALVWIALVRLLLDPECQRKYEINNYKKNQLLKLRVHINNKELLDQIPCLEMLQEYLEKLSIFDPAPAKSDLIIVECGGIREKILEQGKYQWKDIAEEQAKSFFNPSSSQLKDHALRMAETYQLDILEQLITEDQKCAMCSKKATKKCSQCLNEWYCQRECQVKHWTKHKQICSLITRK